MMNMQKMQKKQTIGEFQEKEFGAWFTYSETTDPWALAQGFKHEIDVLDGVRFANVMKTVVHICIDEDAPDNALVDKWQIKNHTLHEQN